MNRLSENSCGVGSNPLGVPACAEQGADCSSDVAPRGTFEEEARSAVVDRVEEAAVAKGGGGLAERCCLDAA